MFSPLTTLDEMPLEMSHLATYLQMQQVGGPPISDADTFSDTSWFNVIIILLTHFFSTPDEKADINFAAATCFQWPHNAG